MATKFKMANFKFHLGHGTKRLFCGPRYGPHIQTFVHASESDQKLLFKVCDQAI